MGDFIISGAGFPTFPTSLLQRNVDSPLLHTKKDYKLYLLLQLSRLRRHTKKQVANYEGVRMSQLSQILPAF